MISEVCESLPLPFGIYLVESKKRKINNRLRLPPSLSSHCPYLGRYTLDICALLHFMSQCITLGRGAIRWGRKGTRNGNCGSVSLSYFFPLLPLSGLHSLPNPTRQVLHQHSLGKIALRFRGSWIQFGPSTGLAGGRFRTSCSDILCHTDRQGGAPWRAKFQFTLGEGGGDPRK